MSISRPRASPENFEARIRHPLLKQLFQFWEAASSDGRVLEVEFDLMSLPAALKPRLHIIDIPEDGGECRNRFLGPYVIEAVGLDFEGHKLTDERIPNVTGSVTHQLLQNLLIDAKPQYHRGRSRFAAARRFATHEQILLPLFDCAGRVVAAVGAVDYGGSSSGALDIHQGAAFYTDMAVRIYELARRCSPADRAVADQLRELGRELVQRAIRLGADPDDIPLP